VSIRDAFVVKVIKMRMLGYTVPFDLDEKILSSTWTNNY